MQLIHKDFEVSVTSDGIEALKVALKDRPNLIS